MNGTSRIWQRFGSVAIAGVCAGLVTAGAQSTPQTPPDLAPSAAIDMFGLSPTPPHGAIVLFSGKKEQLQTNFYKRYTSQPADWTVDDNGVSTPNKDDITTRLEFGDCYVHAEFASTLDANGRAVAQGNSGVGMQGRYEIQILESYGHKADAEDCGAFYGQKAPIANPSKKPGEWQTFDILFRAPRFDSNNLVTQKARATVFMNGVLVQNNEEFSLANFAAWDANGVGQLDEREMTRLIQDPAIKGETAAAVAALKISLSPDQDRRSPTTLTRRDFQTDDIDFSSLISNI
jgi:hypothetical protein